MKPLSSQDAETVSPATIERAKSTLYTGAQDASICLKTSSIANTETSNQSTLSTRQRTSVSNVKQAKFATGMETQATNTNLNDEQNTDHQPNDTITIPSHSEINEKSLASLPHVSSVKTPRVEGNQPTACDADRNPTETSSASPAKALLVHTTSRGPPTLRIRKKLMKISMHEFQDKVSNGLKNRDFLEMRFTVYWPRANSRDPRQLRHVDIIDKDDEEAFSEFKDDLKEFDGGSVTVELISKGGDGATTD